MEQLPVKTVEFGVWKTNKYDHTEIFKAANGISVSVKATPKKSSEWGINIMGKELDVYFNDVEEAKIVALAKLKEHLTSALEIITWGSTVIPK